MNHNCADYQLSPFAHTTTVRANERAILNTLDWSSVSANAEELSLLESQEFGKLPESLAAGLLSRKLLVSDANAARENYLNSVANIYTKGNWADLILDLSSCSDDYKATDISEAVADTLRSAIADNSITVVKFRIFTGNAHNSERLQDCFSHIVRTIRSFDVDLITLVGIPSIHSHDALLALQPDAYFIYWEIEDGNYGGHKTIHRLIQAIAARIRRTPLIHIRLNIRESISAQYWRKFATLLKHFVPASTEFSITFGDSGDIPYFAPPACFGFGLPNDQTDIITREFRLAGFSSPFKLGRVLNGIYCHALSERLTIIDGAASLGHCYHASCNSRSTVRSSLDKLQKERQCNRCHLQPICDAACPLLLENSSCSSVQHMVNRACTSWRKAC